MKKILLGLPIVLIGIFIICLPGIIFGEIGFLVEKLVLFFILIDTLAFAIGDMVLNYLKDRE